MQWEIGPVCVCTSDPIQRGFIFFIMITSIYVLAHLINNRVWLFYTRKGLKRIENSFKAGLGTDQPVQLKDMEFKKVGRFSVVNAILKTFRDLEELKGKENYLKLWELKTRSLKDRIEGTFFKRNPFVTICVVSICIGIAVFAKEILVAFQYMSVSGSGGVEALISGLSEALIIPIIASINCALSALAYLSAKKSAKKISSEITKLEIRLIGGK